MKDKTIANPLLLLLIQIETIEINQAMQQQNKKETETRINTNSMFQWHNLANYFLLLLAWCVCVTKVEVGTKQLYKCFFATENARENGLK